MKNRSFKILISLVAMVGSLALNVACGQQATQARVSDSPSDGDDGSGGGNSPTLPSTLDNVFKIYTSFSNPAVKSYNHDRLSLDWSKDCTVSPSATSDALKYLDCILEVHELDLFHSSLALGFNVPANMCEYVQVKPYWYWRGSAGLGPESVAVTVVGTAPPNITSAPSHSLYPSIGAAYVDGQLKCTADHSSDYAGKNCCEGKYTLTTTTITPASGGSPSSTTTSVTKGNWGGKIGNCAMGAADEFPGGREKTHAVPKDVIYTSRDGITGAASTFKISAPINVDYQDIIHTANFYDPALFHPPSMEFVARLNGNPANDIKPQKYYEYTCLDEAWDAKARIRLQVRRWTSREQLALKGDWNLFGPEPNPTNPDPYGDILDTYSWEVGFDGALLQWSDNI